MSWPSYRRFVVGNMGETGNSATVRGQVQVSVTREAIDLTRVVQVGPASPHGAGNVFAGYVRDLNMGKKVLGIEYDSFEPLTEKIFRDICHEAQEEWGHDLQIFVIHRIGYLKVGEISVAIFVTSGHRDESYQASRYVIEEIKTRAPIWKKEFYQDSQSEWVRGHALCQHAPGTHRSLRGKTCHGDHGH